MPHNHPPDILKNLDVFYESRLKILAHNLKALRGTKSVEEISYLTGISRTQLNLMENQNANVTIKTIAIVESLYEKDILIIGAPLKNLKK